jgi:16S rRNA (guanine966-N2)-methyltransferase
MLDREPRVVTALRQMHARLGGPEIEVRCLNALAYLAGEPEPFDIVFLDPPFGSGLLPSVVERLCEGGWLAPGARLYVESDDAALLRSLGARLPVDRLKKAGNVWYGLLRAPDRDEGRRQDDGASEQA